MRNCHGVTVGSEPAVARIVLDHKRHARADDGGGTSKHEIGFTPSHGRDKKRCERRYRERSDANPADREAGGETSAPGKPSLNSTERRNVGKANSHSDAEAIGRVNLRQGAGEACGGQARSGQDHAGHRERARAPPVGKRTADDA